MLDLLFLVHRIPFPPNKGDKIRSWNILSHLCRNYRVHVGGFVDDPHDWQYLDRVDEVAESTCFVPLHRKRATVKSAFSLISGDPQTLGYYGSKRLRRWAQSRAVECNVQRIFVYSSSMAQFVPSDLPAGCRTVIDFVDIDSDKWRQYAERKPWPMSAIYRREATTLFQYEKKTASGADASIFVSEDEAEMFRRIAPDVRSDIFGIANGVDCDFFDPGQSFTSPYSDDGPVLVFTGAMDYWANVDAVRWFVDEVFPGIRTRTKDASFWIVGANPTAEVQKLAERDGVFVTGRVEDVRPYIAHATLSVAPLRVARGIQNKVLEAMSLGKAVVATPQAMEGIAAIDEKEVVIADGPENFASAVNGLIIAHNSNHMGEYARQRVIADYAWLSKLQQFERVLEGLEPGGRLSPGRGD